LQAFLGEPSSDGNIDGTIVEFTHTGLVMNVRFHLILE